MTTILKMNSMSYYHEKNNLKNILINNTSDSKYENLFMIFKNLFTFMGRLENISCFHLIQVIQCHPPLFTIVDSLENNLF